MFRKVLVLTLASALAGVPAYAQMGHQQHAGQRSGGGMACPGMKGGASTTGMHGGAMQGPGMMGMMRGGMGGMMGGPMSQMQGMMGGAMMGHGMMGEPGPGMLLRLKGALELTGEQVSRLEGLQQKFSQQHEEHVKAADEAQRAAAEALRGEQPDLAAYEAKLKEAAAHGVEAHVVAARAALEARSVLTDEQRAKLRTGMAMMREAMCSMMGGQGQP